MSDLKSAFSQGLFQQSATKRERFGALRIEADGRKFRYGKAGAAIGAGKNTSQCAAAANHVNLAIPAAYPIGSMQIAVTVGATAVTADAYADGFLQVNDATGEGYSYRIESNTACDASGTTIVQLADPIQVALVASTSEVSLIPNPWSSVITNANPTDAPAGCAMRAMTSGYYGWFQTGGMGIYLSDGTPAVGQMLVLSSTDGALEIGNATYTSTEPIVAIATSTAGVDTEYKPCIYKID